MGRRPMRRKVLGIVSAIALAIGVIGVPVLAEDDATTESDTCRDLLATWVVDEFGKLKIAARDLGDSVDDLDAWLDELAASEAGQLVCYLIKEGVV